ncbi:effector-associated domain EAD1-containing protein [Pseudomonas sp. NPDC090202]|uniref:GAP1-N1 domain-containing protein n=1 Tax=Pseudomonas sp. NPDC090202 TaxID=3364476 RepID=UPI00380E584D
MIVEQAIFGEALGGHGLRLASDVSRIPPGLAARLDLPDTAPPGVVWSPYVSGFALGDWYILARTFADPFASRPGMVTSHAVLAPLQEILCWEDLRPLLGLLINSPQPPDALTSVELPSTTAMQAASSDLDATAQALLTRGKGPVVRIGLDGWEDLITALWANCWPAIRARFAFRLSFGPHDVVELPEPTIVCSPSVLAARWGGHRIVGTGSSSAITRAAAMLSGNSEGAPLLRYAQEIGAQVTQFADLPMLERVFEASTSVTSTFEQCLASIRLIERLSPNCSDGPVAKEVVIEKFLLQLDSATVGQVLQMRNLNAGGFAPSSKIWVALESWAAGRKFAPQEDAQMLSAIKDALSTSDALEPWRNAIITGIHIAACTTASEFPAAFWRWAAESGDILQALSIHLPADGNLEDRLVNAAPAKVTDTVGDVVMQIASKKKWYALHGAAAGACLAVRVAVDRQLSIDVAVEYHGGLRAVLRDVTSAQLLDTALSVVEPRLLLIAAERIAKSPELLSDVNIAEARVQELWLKTLEFNADAWEGPREPQEAFFCLLQNLVEGRAVNRQLITKLSTTPLADLSEYPRAAEVWGRVHEPVLENLLRATTLGWLDRAARGSISTPDARLQAFMLAGPDLYLALEKRMPPKDSIQIMGIFPQFGESRLIGWLDVWATSPKMLSTSEAEALGQLILKRNLNRAADRLFTLRSRRSDIWPALRLCSDLLGAINRWRVRLSSRSTQDDWECLEAVAVELYPGGPDHEELWSRAGGRNADLQHGGSGRSRWYHTLAQMKNGKGVHVRSLVKEMRREYPSNELLRELDNDAHF